MSSRGAGWVRVKAIVWPSGDQSSSSSAPAPPRKRVSSDVTEYNQTPSPATASSVASGDHSRSFTESPVSRRMSSDSVSTTQTSPTIAFGSGVPGGGRDAERHPSAVRRPDRARRECRTFERDRGRPRRNPVRAQIGDDERRVAAVAVFLVSGCLPEQKTAAVRRERRAHLVGSVGI